MAHPQFFRTGAARVARAAALLVAVALEAGLANAVALHSLEVESKARDLERGGTSDFYEPTPVSATRGPLTDAYAAAVAVPGGMDASAFVRGHADYGLLRAEAIALAGSDYTRALPVPVPEFEWVLAACLGAMVAARHLMRGAHRTQPALASRRARLRCVALLGSALVGASASAVPTVDLELGAGARVTRTQIGNDASDTFATGPTSSVQGPLSEAYFASAVTPVQHTSAFVRGYADYGTLRAEVVAFANSYANPNTGEEFGRNEAGGSARVSFLDELSIVGGTPGTQGVVTLLLVVEGSGSIASSHSDVFVSGALVTAQATLEGFSSLTPMPVQDSAGPGSGGFVSTILHVDVPFTFGEIVQVRGTLTTAAIATADGLNVGEGAYATGVSDFWNTLRWGGIRDVRDANGNLLEGWSVSSASGTDYSRAFPVPEPNGSLLSLITAAIGLGSRNMRAPGSLRRRLLNRLLTTSPQ